MTPGTVIQADDIGRSVPLIAPLGLYNFHMSAGVFPSIQVGDDAFEFTVTAAMDGASGGSGWEAMGYASAFNRPIAEADRPSRYSLSDASPNRFNSSTATEVMLPEAAELQVAVYDVLGREVMELANGISAPGSISWPLTRTGWRAGYISSGRRSRGI